MDPKVEPSVDVRPARRQDKDLLVRWVCAVAEESEGVRLEEATVEKGVVAALGDPEHRRYFIAERSGECVGCCLVTTEWSDWTATWYWWLQSIYVEPEHRGKKQGVLKALLEEVHKRARDAGVRKVSLYVHQENGRAIRAYQREGYKRDAHLIYEHPL